MAAAADAAERAAGGTPRKDGRYGGDGDSEDAGASSGDQALSATAVKVEVAAAGEELAESAPAPGGEESKWGATWFDQVGIGLQWCRS